MVHSQLKPSAEGGQGWFHKLYHSFFGRLRSSRRLLRAILSALLFLQLLTVVVVLLSTQAYQGRVLTQHAQEVIRQMVASAESDLKRQLAPAQNTTVLLDQLDSGIVSLVNPDPLERTFRSSSNTCSRRTSSPKECRPWSPACSTTPR